jgi:predicted acylesterase/phospholipase RssA
MSATVDHATKVRRAQRADENRQSRTFRPADLLPCDIVMKGGITSGVVYPGAVLRLARHYRFRSIGGTSAGAIAAAVVAAAEHARERDGFVRLAGIPEQLTKKRFMLQLFQADEPARPLFEAITGVMEHGKAKGLPLALTRFWKAPVTALGVAGTAIALSTAGDAGPAYAVGGVAAALGILVVGLGVDVAKAVGRIAENDFGMCRLGPGVGTEDEPALTGWLHREIQRVAGRPGGPPLTFADLWGAGAPAPGVAFDDPGRVKDLARRSRDPKERNVDLQMVTTDLTHGRPIRLPVPYRQHEDVLEDEGCELLYRPSELARFFAADVLQHLERCSTPVGPAPPPGTPDDRLRTFPIGADLPVVVAARMSLSFPFLIAAVPLWRSRDDRPGEPYRVRFSDGGVTSNFPIHFFDSPLPKWPTFGLHLTSFARGEASPPIPRERAVVAPGAPDEPAPDPPAQIDSLRSFVAALKDAGQNWRDNAQASLPGFRDRVVHIKLTEDEGGLNLDMDPAVIEDLDDRGDLAGLKLVELFAGADAASTPPRHWNDHRFTRYRTTMALAERWLRSYQEGWCYEPQDGRTVPYDDRVQAGLDAPFEFPDEAVRDAALRRSSRYAGIVHDPSLDDRGIPRPPSVLRTVPPV